MTSKVLFLLRCDINSACNTKGVAQKDRERVSFLLSFFFSNFSSDLLGDFVSFFYRGKIIPWRLSSFPMKKYTQWAIISKAFFLHMTLILLYFLIVWHFC